MRMTYSFFMFFFNSFAKLYFFSETDKRFSRKLPFYLQKVIITFNTLKIYIFFSFCFNLLFCEHYFFFFIFYLLFCE